MASITREPNGRRTIQFVGSDGKRRSIRLGKVSQRFAEVVQVKVEHLAAAQTTGGALDGETARWVAERDTVMLDKLAAVGLIPKQQRATLQSFLDSYIASRVDVKPATKEIWGQGKRGLIDFFGSDKPVREVTAGDADNYKMHLIAQKLASMTVRKRLQFAKTVFRAMVKHKLLAENPFAEVTTQATMAQGRQHFITVEDTAKLLTACPDSQWRVIVALSRYGGLRCPSEVLSLRWQDIDWNAGRIRVTSPKTECHPGKGTRTIPLFPELRPILEEAWEVAPEGAVYVCGEKYRVEAIGPHGWRNINLRTRFEAIVDHAGLKPWPRLFHNMRASRETELCERFPLHAVASWLGNTPTIAQRHYLQTTEQHFQDALKSSEKAVHNPVQQVQEIRCKPSQENKKPPVFAGVCESSQYYTYAQADGEGFEPPVDSRLQWFSRPPP